MPKEAQGVNTQVKNPSPVSQPGKGEVDDKSPESMKQTKRTVLVVYFVLILMGIGTGYLLHQSLNNKGILPGTQKVTMTKTDKMAGVNDTEAFKDSAEGVIEKGGVDGEGTHKLTREGGPSQTAALVSSVLDLDEYDGKKVKVWGQTYPPKKAGWFMDVGKIELRE